MDIKGIKKVIELMKENELSEFELAEEGFRITIKRRNGGEPQVMVSSPAQPMMMTHTMAPSGAPAAAAPAKPEVPENTVAIKSPMVGTFYRAASPEAEPFCSVGKEVE